MDIWENRQPEVRGLAKEGGGKMSMKRFVREEDEDIYDRLTREWIEPSTERYIGEYLYINERKEDEIVIPRDNIEERR